METAKEKKKSLYSKRHKDSEWCDEVWIVDVDKIPILRCKIRYRYKTSGLSGDEWRISSSWEVLHDGEYMYLENAPGYNIKTACQGIFPVVYSSLKHLHKRLIRSIDWFYKGHKIYESTYDDKPIELIFALGHLPFAYIAACEDPKFQPFCNNEEYCFQPGCKNKAISTYHLKSEYCDEGKPHNYDWCINYRRFCEKHLRRGDCALEDADDNYIVVDGPGPNDAKNWQKHESKAIFGGITEINLD